MKSKRAALLMAGVLAAWSAAIGISGIAAAVQPGAARTHTLRRSSEDAGMSAMPRRKCLTLSRTNTISGIRIGGRRSKTC
jgi:hypothetical protein